LLSCLNDMGSSYETIALRALNATKTVNPITYLGIRCFLDSFSGEFDEHGFECFIRHKLEVRTNWLTWEHKVFKEINQGDFVYRDFISLSPFGVISEAFLLREILSEKCFEHKENVYSYIPSKKSSYRNFNYYFNGFKVRNEKIKQEIDKNKQLNILILDLKAFYPSISEDKLLEKFEKLRERGLSENSYKITINLIKYLLNQPNKGVPIGTDLSHFLAQIYLHDFDVKLIELFGNRYFRYVDDIAILAEANEIEYIKTIVKSNLPVELDFKDDKTTQLTSDDWNKMHYSIDNKDTFYGILNLLTAYLAVYPEKIESLKFKLKEKNINIPLIRIQNQSKSKGWRYFLRKIIKIRHLLFIDEDFFISNLTNIKQDCLSKLNELLINSNFTDENDACNRAKVQELRFIVSRLFYLLPRGELEEIDKKLPNINKIADLKAVINAVTKMDLISACNYGGKVIQTICEIWVEANLDMIALSEQDLMKFDNINNAIESILVMRLYGIIEFDFKDISSLLNDRNVKYCAIVLGYKVDLTDDEKKFSYLSELYGLFKGRTLEEKREFLITRFDQEEELILAGLTLGFGYSL